MTTHYNHSTLGTAEKPLIPNMEFKRMCESVRAGNPDISEWTDKYELEMYQKRLIEQMIIQLKKKQG